MIEVKNSGDEKISCMSQKFNHMLK